MFLPDTVVEVVAKHHRTAAQRIGKTPVVIKRAAQAGKRRLECRFAAQFATGQTIQRTQAGAAVRFGKDHVETDDGNAVVVEQAGDELRHLVAAPRPAPLLGQTFLVDVEDYDARIDARGSRQAQTRVIDEGVERIEQRNLVEAGRMAKKNQRQRQTKGDPNEVFFQCISGKEGRLTIMVSGKIPS